MNDTMIEGLKERPWLEPFLEDGDEDLEPARNRWRAAVKAAKAELRKLGFQLHERAKTSSGLETTMLIMPTEPEKR